MICFVHTRHDGINGWDYHTFFVLKMIIGCVTLRFGHTDLVCIPPSALVRFIIRKEDEHYVSVTAAYMHVLHGEAMQMFNRGELPCQTIYLH